MPTQRLFTSAATPPWPKAPYADCTRSRSEPSSIRTKRGSRFRDPSDTGLPLLQDTPPPTHHSSPNLAKEVFLNHCFPDPAVAISDQERRRGPEHGTRGSRRTMLAEAKSPPNKENWKAKKKPLFLGLLMGLMVMAMAFVALPAMANRRARAGKRPSPHDSRSWHHSHGDKYERDVGPGCGSGNCVLALGSQSAAARQLGTSAVDLRDNARQASGMKLFPVPFARVRGYT